MSASAPKRSGPRVEWKAVLPREHADAVLAWARGRMAPDGHATDAEHGLYFVESVYCDTQVFGCLRGGRTGLPKYRIRRYNRDDARWWVEEKLRRGEDVYKRRVEGTRAEIEQVLAGDAPLAGPYEWFRSRFRVLQLRPTLRVEYDRVARQQGGVRLTVDRAVAAEPTGVLAFEQAAQPVLDGDVLEVKFSGPPTALARDLMHRAGGQGERCSKYVIGMRTLHLAPGYEQSA